MGANEGATLVIGPTASWKSTSARKKQVAVLKANPRKTVATLVPRHELGTEHMRKLSEEFAGEDITSKAWRGFDRVDEEFIGPQKPPPAKPHLMCWRPEEATLVRKALLSVKTHLCHYEHWTSPVVYDCAFQAFCASWRQRHARADLTAAAHEMMVHELQPAFGKVAFIHIDENPLKAMMFGVDVNDVVEIKLEKLRVRPKGTGLWVDELMRARQALYKVLSRMTLPPEEHLGAPVTAEMLHEFMPAPQTGPPAPPPAQPASGGTFDGVNGILAAIFENADPWGRFDPKQMARLEWYAKVVPPVRPGMSLEKIEAMLAPAKGNAMIRKFEALWENLGHPGRVQVHQGEDGRYVKVKGLRKLAKGWEATLPPDVEEDDAREAVPTLITDATGDPELLRYIWPELKCSTSAWEQMPRPSSVRVFQVIDCSFSMNAIVPDGEKAEKLAEEEAALRRTWGAVLASAAQYGGQSVGVVIYKESRAWIEEHCYVPPWLVLLHHGATTGTNRLEKVRAFYAVGRTLPNAEAITSETEALTGEYIAERGYVKVEKGAKIHLAPNASGHNTALVDYLKHPHPVAERIRRQKVEGDALQTFGRARVNLRDENSPLDVYLLHDVAIPEIGEVQPLLRDELQRGPEIVMLAGGGKILENAAHAEKCFPGLINKGTYRNARSGMPAAGEPRVFGIPGGPRDGTQSVTISYMRVLL